MEVLSCSIDDHPSTEHGGSYMKRYLIFSLVVAGLFVAAGQHHVKHAFTPDTIPWGPAPPVVHPGAQFGPRRRSHRIQRRLYGSPEIDLSPCTNVIKRLSATVAVWCFCSFGLDPVGSRTDNSMGPGTFRLFFMGVRELAPALTERKRSGSLVGVTDTLICCSNCD